MPWRRFAAGFERMVYVIAGLPIALRAGSVPTNSPAQAIRQVFARRYWRPESLGEALELTTGLILAPLAVPLAALWFTARNGAIIRRREGKGLTAQFLEQLQLLSCSRIFSCRVHKPCIYCIS